VIAEQEEEEEEEEEVLVLWGDDIVQHNHRISWGSKCVIGKSHRWQQQQRAAAAADDVQPGHACHHNHHRVQRAASWGSQAEAEPAWDSRPRGRGDSAVA